MTCYTRHMRILGIETSCDETSVAIVEGGRTVLANVTQSSCLEHAATRGILPEAAARRQLEFMLPVLDAALRTASVTLADIDAIAVTSGPGLIGSLLVGVATARTLAVVHNLPLIGIHHTLGHLSSTWLLPTSERSPATSSSPPQFPVLTLSVSGGHTDLWYRTGHTSGLLLGQTLDDAAGEAFDKGAVLLDLGFPGGPALSRFASGGAPSAIPFPRPLLGAPRENLDFSFSGLKTALRYTLRDRGGLSSLTEQQRRDVAASYQEAICRHLLDRIDRALDRHPESVELHLVGGVSANHRLRELLHEALSRRSSPPLLRLPAEMAYCTDNAAMIAAAGYFLWTDGKVPSAVKADAGARLDTVVTIS